MSVQFSKGDFGRGPSAEVHAAESDGNILRTECQDGPDARKCAVFPAFTLTRVVASDVIIMWH